MKKEQHSVPTEEQNLQSPNWNKVVEEVFFTQGVEDAVKLARALGIAGITVSVPSPDVITSRIVDVVKEEFPLFVKKGVYLHGFVGEDKAELAISFTPFVQVTPKTEGGRVRGTEGRSQAVREAVELLAAKGVNLSESASSRDVAIALATLLKDSTKLTNYLGRTKSYDYAGQEIPALVKKLREMS